MTESPLLTKKSALKGSMKAFAESLSEISLNAKRDAEKRNEIKKTGRKRSSFLKMSFYFFGLLHVAQLEIGQVPYSFCELRILPVFW